MDNLTDLVDLHYLKKLLHYQDFRSVRSWCKKNGVPLIVLGRKTYTERRFIIGLINNKLGIRNDSEGTNDAIRINDGVNAVMPTKTVITASKRKEIRRNKNKHSKAATDLLNAIFD